MPTTATNTWGQKKIEPQLGVIPLTTPVRFSASKTITKGTVLGKVTATGKFEAYSDANSPAGVGVALGIAIYDITTDSSGNITNLGDQGSVQTHADIYHSGCFKVSDLTGLDAAAVADLFARYVGGDSSSAGYLVIPA